MTLYYQIRMQKAKRYREDPQAYFRETGRLQGDPSPPSTFVSKDPTKSYYGKEVFATKQGKIRPTSEYRELPSGEVFKVSEASPAVRQYARSTPKQRTMPVPYQTTRAATTTPSSLYNVSVDGGRQFVASSGFVSKLRTATGQEKKDERPVITMASSVPFWERPSFRQEKIRQLSTGTAPELRLAEFNLFGTDIKINKPESFLIRTVGSPERYYERALVPQYRLERKISELGITSSRQYKEFQTTGKGFGRFYTTQIGKAGIGAASGALETVSSPITTAAVVGTAAGTGGGSIFTGTATTGARAVTTAFILPSVATPDPPVSIGKAAGAGLVIGSTIGIAAGTRAAGLKALRTARTPSLTSTKTIGVELKGSSGYASDIATTSEYGFRYGKFREQISVSSKGFQQDYPFTKVVEDYSVSRVTQSIYKDRPFRSPELVSKRTVGFTQEIQLQPVSRTEFEGVFTLSSRGLDTTRFGVVSGSKLQTSPITYDFTAQAVEFGTGRYTPRVFPDFDFNVVRSTDIFARGFKVTKQTTGLKGATSVGSIIETSSVRGTDYTKLDFASTQQNIRYTGADISRYKFIPEQPTFRAPEIKTTYPTRVFKVTPNQITKTTLSSRTGDVLSFKQLTATRQVVQPITESLMVSQVKQSTQPIKIESPSSILSVRSSSATTTRVVPKSTLQKQSVSTVTATRQAPITRTSFNIISGQKSALSSLSQQSSRLSTGLRSAQQSRLRSSLRTSLITTPSFSTGIDINLRLTPIVPSGFDAKLPEFPKIKRRKKEEEAEFLGFSTRYSPSVEAGLFGVRGQRPSIPEISTGLNIRPIIR